MSRASPQMRSIAKQLMAPETGEESAAADNSTPFRALEKLRPHLSMLMGPGGYQALLARALVLATAEVPWLNSLQVDADGELRAVGAPAAFEVAVASEAEVVLLTQLLGLLVAFVGPALTLRLLTQMWPQLSLDDAEFSQRPNEERAK